MLGVVTARGRPLWGVLVLVVAGGVETETTPTSDLTDLVHIYWSEHVRSIAGAQSFLRPQYRSECVAKYGHLEVSNKSVTRGPLRPRGGAASCRAVAICV